MAKISLGKFKWLWVNLLAMVVVALGLVYGLFSYLDTYTRHGQAVAIPQVKGMDYQDAIQALEAKGLEPVVSDSDYMAQMPAGVVLELTPQEGQLVKKGRVVYMTINNLSIPLMSVPDVVDNSSLRQAEARLLASGFTVLESELVSGEKDWVYGVKYQGRVLGQGEKVPAGAALSLQVGVGGELVDTLAVDSLGNMILQRIPIQGVQDKTPKSESSESWF